jgi:type I restriction enzyme S subunit
VEPTAIDNNCLGLIPNSSVSSDFLLLILKGIDFAKYQAGTSVPALSQGVIGRIRVRIPEIHHQRLVVEMVTELLALCDQLKARIAAARAKQVQIAATLVADALAA